MSRNKGLFYYCMSYTENVISIAFAICIIRNWIRLNIFSLFSHLFLNTAYIIQQTNVIYSAENSVCFQYFQLEMLRHIQ